jgi:hypothetical protein
MTRDKKNKSNRNVKKRRRSFVYFINNKHSLSPILILGYSKFRANIQIFLQLVLGG